MLRVWWTIEEYKFWQGLDKTCWARRPGEYLSDHWNEMQGLVDYLEKNNPELVLRVNRWE